MQSHRISPTVQVSWSEVADGDMKNSSNLNDLLSAQGRPSSRLLLEHGTTVQIAQPANTELTGDAIITNHPNHVISFVVGDCFPVVLSDAEHNVVALIHCGWKSLYLGILGKTVETLEQQFSTKPSDLTAWICPGICAKHYIHAQEPEQTTDPDWINFVSKKEDGYHVDLAGFIKQSLKRVGLTQITHSGICTFEKESHLFSHHRSLQTGEEDGRFLVAVSS